MRSSHKAADRLVRWLPVLAWIALISTFSTSWFSGDQTGSFLLPLVRSLLPWASEAQVLAIHFAVRKLAHFTEYLVLGILLYRALDRRGELDQRTSATTLGLGALVAASDELHQWFVPTRSAAVGDWLIDCSGVAAGLLLIAAGATWLTGARRARA